jgi:arsenate reductase (thioredoxin)
MASTAVTVIFACVHNAGRSQMAAAFFTATADPSVARATSAGTQPGDHVHPEVVDAMRELAVDLGTGMPRLLTAELAREVQIIVTMGCGESCPLVPGVRRIEWTIADPIGQSPDRVRAIRDAIREHVRAFVAAEGWQRHG